MQAAPGPVALPSLGYGKPHSFALLPSSFLALEASPPVAPAGLPSHWLTACTAPHVPGWPPYSAAAGSPDA